MKFLIPFNIVFSSLICLSVHAQIGLHVAPNHTVVFGQDTTSFDVKLMWIPSKGAFRSGIMKSAWNYTNLGNASTAFGSDTQASGNYSLATGLGTEANSFAETSIGRYALFGGSATIWDDTGADVVFEIGNGPSPSVRSNMLTIQKSGNIRIGDMTNGAEVIEEKLVVDGGIVISDALDLTPAEGTIRWNSDNQDFEGWNGSEWLSLTRPVLEWGRSPSAYEDSKFSNGSSFEYLGSAISIDGDYAVVGSPDGGNLSLDKGSAVVFKKDSNDNWQYDTRLTASDGNAQDYFGSSVSISGTYIVIGAPGDEEGSAYMFRRSGSTWIEEDKVSANDASAGASFGTSVDISGIYVVIGARIN